MAKEATTQKPDQRSEDFSRTGPTVDSALPVSGSATNMAEDLKEREKQLRERGKAQDKARGEFDKASDSVSKARAEAEKARAEVEEENLSDAQRKARKADQKVADLEAEAAQARREYTEASGGETTADAKALAAALVSPVMSAGDHYAQKFGNDPENPKLAPGISGDPTERLQRVTPDSPTPIYTMVHKEMVGDYLRAGWSLADAS